MNFELDHNYLKYYEIQEGDTLIDLGATVGEFGIIHREEIIQNHALLISVEPDTDSFRKMQDNYRQYSIENTININMGIWNEDTILPFTATDNPWCNMFDIHGHDVSSVAGHIKNVSYPVITLSSLISKYHWIDFLKADIEGAELEVFMSCEEIKRIKNLAIASYHIRNGIPTYIPLSTFFMNLGYRVILESIPYGHFPPYAMLYASLE